MFLWVATTAPSLAEARRVLLLESFGREFSPYAEFTTNLRVELARQSPDPVDFYEVSLASARRSERELDAPFSLYISSLFADQKLALIVTIGAPAVRFVQRHRQDLFGSTPMILTGVDERRVESFGITSNDTSVTFRSDLPALISNIFHVLPDTKTIAVLVGSSPNDQFWLNTMRSEFQVFAGRAEFRWIHSSFDDMRLSVARLPPKSAVFYSTVTVDSRGEPVESTAALESLHAIGTAPLFGVFDYQVGSGVVGGPVISLTELAREAASAAVRILGGDSPSKVKITALEQSGPIYDARELERWGISEKILPAGSIIRFRVPSIWDSYRIYVASASIFFFLESFLIVALLLANRRRRIAEEQAQALTGRLITTQEEERARLARELHDDVTQRLASLAIETGRGERQTQDMSARSVLRAVQDKIARLSEDVHVLSYQLHPSVLHDLGLAEAISAECERQGRLSGISIEMDARDIPEKLPRETALGLFRVAQESLRNITRHARATQADIALETVGGGVQLTIRDDGIGFDPARSRSNPTLGLESMRQRISLLGGRLEIKSYLGKGTVISAWVPIREPE